MLQTTPKKIMVIIGSLDTGGAEKDVVRIYPKLNPDKYKTIVTLYIAFLLSVMVAWNFSSRAITEGVNCAHYQNAEIREAKETLLVE